MLRSETTSEGSDTIDSVCSKTSFVLVSKEVPNAHYYVNYIIIITLMRTITEFNLLALFIIYTLY